MGFMKELCQVLNVEGPWAFLRKYCNDSKSIKAGKKIKLN